MATLKTFFIDCIKGNDINDGSELKPKLTINKISNNSIIVLSDGYHKNITLSNINNIIIISKDLYDSLSSPINFKNIKAKNPQKNLLTKVVYISLTNCSNVFISDISVSASHFIPSTDMNTIKIRGVTFKNCSDCVFQNSELYSVKDTKKWNMEDWNKNRTGIVIIGGKGNNKILNNNIVNCGGIQLKGVLNIVDNNFIKNFPTDGCGIWADGNIFSNNWIEGSHLVNINHNDLIQCGASNNWKILNNTFISYYSGMSFISRTTQGIGCFDGWYNNCEISGNRVKVDHPIGIWMQGANNCKISNNEVMICGSILYKNHPPSILIKEKKSGENSTNNIVINNIAPKFDFVFQNNTNNIQYNNYSTLLNKFIEPYGIKNNTITQKPFIPPFIGPTKAFGF
jgi:parallel beta-helix repeat protein